MDSNRIALLALVGVGSVTPKPTALRPGSLIMQTEGLAPVTSDAAPCLSLIAFSSWLPSQPLTAPPRHRTFSPRTFSLGGPIVSGVPETNTKWQRPAEKALPRAPAPHTTSNCRSKGAAGLQQPEPKIPPASTPDAPSLRPSSVPVGKSKGTDSGMGGPGRQF